MFSTNTYSRAGFLTALGLSTAAFLSGCGGSTNNAGPAPAATPTIYGLNPADNTTGSSLQFTVAGTDAKGNPTSTLTAALTAALSSTAKPLEGTVPLGFPNLGAPAAVTAAAVSAGQTNVTFRVLVANGNAGNGISAINPSSLVLTSPEVTGFSQALTFDGAGAGNGVNAGQYTTAAFTLPFTTSGIHQFTAAVSDAAGQSTTTALGIAVAVPTDVTLFLQSFDTGTKNTKTPPAEIFNAITPGDTVTVDGSKGRGVYPTGYAATTADAQGTVVLFTTPGAHTVVETDPAGKMVQTSTFTLPTTAAGTTIYAVPAPAATTTADVSKPHLVTHTGKN